MAALASSAFGLARHSRTGFRHGVIPAASGVVQAAPSAGAFTIQTRTGTTITVDVASTTTYLERGVSSPTLANVVAGDLVAVFGTVSGSTVTAAEIVIKVPASATAGGSAPAGAGLVTGTPGSTSFVIQTRSGQTDTVNVSSTTTYSERGVTSPTLADVATNDFVLVYGTLSGTTITATQVVIGSSHAHSEFRLVGSVATAPAADSFTVTTRSGATDTVDVSTATQYYERGVTGANLTNVAAGDFVAVFGTISGSTVTATRILILPPPPTLTSGASATIGTVQTTPAAGSFVIQTRAGTQYTIDTSSTTTYTERHNASASLSNVAIGEEVAVFGTVSGTTVTATQIAIAGVGFGEGPGHPFGGRPSGPGTGTTTTGTTTTGTTTTGTTPTGGDEGPGDNDGPRHTGSGFTSGSGSSSTGASVPAGASIPTVNAGSPLGGGSGGGSGHGGSRHGSGGGFGFGGDR